MKNTQGRVTEGASLLPWEADDEFGTVKLTMREASYTATSKDEECCADCIHFRRPSYCTKVIGMISPAGWCKFFFEPPEGYKQQMRDADASASATPVAVTLAAKIAAARRR